MGPNMSWAFHDSKNRVSSRANFAKHTDIGRICCMESAISCRHGLSSCRTGADTRIRVARLSTEANQMNVLGCRRTPPRGLAGMMYIEIILSELNQKDDNDWKGYRSPVHYLDRELISNFEGDLNSRP
ncbi:hypothetical protein I7I53_07175 [Histoplasma capsulatum var. duboisii H88]|uniref:Uncharacterized protein n=1 Tax=Ajellomyces capsulatus (strain H88) TaxID=544711 RepID=A0A8A1LCI7_AJEC8|nr:hypothetical protein I7I53_07175 [Histoplasma capsulatum var. duboisii H88]